MALIKCPDCGKEISDKAASCIHCGCPVQEIKIDDQKKNSRNIEVEERIILETKINKEYLKKLKLITTALMIAAVMVWPIFLFLLGEEYAITVTPFMLLFGWILSKIITDSYKRFEKCSLTLTNKRIYGTCFSVNSLGNITNNMEVIDFPLHQVSAVSKLQKTYHDSVRVASSGGAYVIDYVLNADEFRTAVVKELDELKLS